MPAPRLPSDDRRFVALLLVAGIGLRLLWLDRVHGGIDAVLNAGEATRVALAFARGDGIADAYFSGQGPTAHLMPLYPAIVGMILRWLGSGHGAMLALTGLALAQVMATILVLRRLFAAIGVSPAALRWATVLLCLLPFYVPQETVDFRFWEGGMAALLAAINLTWIVRVDHMPAIRPSRMAGIAALAAITFFLSPPVGLAIDLCWAVVAIRRWPLRRVAGFAALAMVATTALIGPWALRNQRELDEPVATRSNFGLELAIANHPAAVSGDRPAETFAARLHTIQPYSNPRLRAPVRAMGEADYARRLGAETSRWIVANPAAFARLYTRHLAQFFFPRPWQFYFSGWDAGRDARSAGISIVQALGLIGLGIALCRRRRGMKYIALYIALLALPFALFQPTARYTYLVWALLAFPAVALLLSVGTAAGRRMRQIGQPPHLTPAPHHRVEDQPGEQA